VEIETTEASATIGDASAKPGKPKVTVPDKPPPSKLVIVEIKKGTGATAEDGKDLTTEYVGVGYRSKYEFDATWEGNKRQPFTFSLGNKEVITGWEEGLVGMKVGGRRELIIPPKYGYGDEKAGAIQPNEALIYVIDLVAVTPTEE
jgi:peptidylprolyl isomerase